MEQEKEEQCSSLAVLDWSIFFLLIIIAGILLSFYALAIQRKGLCLTIQGRAEEAGRLPSVFPLRWKGSVMVTGASAFFFWIASETFRSACCQGTWADQKSARTGLIASALVLAAALLRLEDLEFIGSRSQPQLEETLTPE